MITVLDYIRRVKELVNANSKNPGTRVDITRHPCRWISEHTAGNAYQSGTDTIRHRDRRYGGILNTESGPKRTEPGTGRDSAIGFGVYKKMAIGIVEYDCPKCCAAKLRQRVIGQDKIEKWCILCGYKRVTISRSSRGFNVQKDS